MPASYGDHGWTQPWPKAAAGFLGGEMPHESHLSKTGDFNKESLLQIFSTFCGWDKEKKNSKHINRKRKP